MQTHRFFFWMKLEGQPPYSDLFINKMQAHR